ncbi:hypothetical protein AN958_02999 [Leucoagaricus sp. SymC.cos]|nr:hypothetical protein AN958_02999 [Leucoagaricus sp. SymC.cos]
MLWCFPLPFSFTWQGKRNKSTPLSSTRMQISAPVGLDDRRMQFQPRHHPEAAGNDTGPFYLATNKHGHPPKTIIRRTPQPPLPPLEDDYENVTQAPTTMAQKADTDWGRTRGSPMTGVSSVPMEDNFDGATYAVAGGGDSNTDSAWRTPSSRTRDRAPPRVPPVPKDRYFPTKASTNTPSPVSGSRTAHDTVENYGDYGLYIQGIEAGFPDSDVEPPVERKAPDPVHFGHKELGRIKSREVNRPNLMVRSLNTGHNVTYHTRFDTGAHYGVNPTSRNRRKGPRPQQEYEVDKVVKDTPEKTVTIHTWREQVARETRPNDVETMSIHYMGLDDYAAAERTLTEVDSNLHSAQRTLHEIGRSDSARSTRPADEPSLKDGIRPVVDSEESAPESPVSQTEPELPRPPTPPQKSSSHLPQTRSISSHSRNRSTPPRIATPDRMPVAKISPRSPRAGSRRTMPVFPDPTPVVDPPKSPTPAQVPSPHTPHAFNFNPQPSSPPSAFAAGLNPGSPLQESTPIRATLIIAYPSRVDKAGNYKSGTLEGCLALVGRDA